LIAGYIDSVAGSRDGDAAFVIDAYARRILGWSVATTAPSATVLSAFGPRGSLQPLSGGQETAWLVEAVVLKPLDMAPAASAWQYALLSRLAGRNDFRVSVPLPTADGALIADGWTALRYESGSQHVRRWPEIMDIGRQLHRALAIEPQPPFLRPRTDPWSIGDTVAWGELPATEHASDPHLRRLFAARAPVQGRSQLVHGDLTGNVLFDDDLPPLVIDLSPYWRPPAFASAVVVADAVAFEARIAASSSLCSMTRTSCSACCAP
jgi:hypothetical protein